VSSYKDKFAKPTVWHADAEVARAQQLMNEDSRAGEWRRAELVAGRWPEEMARMESAAAAAAKVRLREMAREKAGAGRADYSKVLEPFTPEE
jgi:hypothetical protein